MTAWRTVAAAAALVFVSACQSQPAFQDPYARPQIDWTPNLLLDADQAGRILGSRSHLEKSTAYLEGGTRTYQCGFRAEEIDAPTGKAGFIGYMYEEYQTAEAARSCLSAILRENRLDPANGIHAGGGVELHYLVGGPVVRMVMILKDSHLLRLKVNPVTRGYSLEEFRRVADELARQL